MILNKQLIDHEGTNRDHDVQWDKDSDHDHEGSSIGKSQTWMSRPEWVVSSIYTNTMVKDLTLTQLN